MTSINGTDPTGLPLAPTPSRERFRLRVEVFLPQDAHSYNAKPYHSFVLAKSRSLNLPDLSLRELRDVVVYRYKTIYPNETLFQISKTTNALGDDLFLDDAVGDIFADNEVFRVIKGASIRESLPRNYRESRERSLQPSTQPSHNGRKRSPNTSNMGDLSRAGKRQRFHEPERPIPSIERFAVIDEEDEGPGSGAEDEDIPDAEQPLQEEAEVVQEADGNAADAAEIVVNPPVAQAGAAPKRRGRPPKDKSSELTPKQPTPTVDARSGSKQSDGKAEVPKKKLGRPRRSMDATLASSSAARSSADARRTPASTSPILSATSLAAKKGAATASVVPMVDTIQGLGAAKSSKMLPPPIVPQGQPARPISPADAARAAQKSNPASSPTATGSQVGASASKKGRRVSFAEPEPSPPAASKNIQNPLKPASQASKPTNGDASHAVVINGSSQGSNAEISENAIENDTAASQPDQEDSQSQDKVSDAPESAGRRGKRNASTISVYQKEKIAEEKAAEQERLAREQAAEEERLAKERAAEEKRRLKEKAAEEKEEKKKAAAEKRAAREAAKEAKANAKAEKEAKKEAEKEAKRKEKEERKLASSQKAASAEAKAPKPSSPPATASAKISVPISDNNSDTVMYGTIDDAPATSPSPQPAPAPESVALPPSSPIMAAKTPKQTTPGPNPDRSPSEASTPGSASTSRSQRDSRSPVHFVTANSQTASKNSFPGSGQKQGTVEESDSDESSSSDEDDDDLDTASAIKPKTPAQIAKEKDVTSTQSVRSTSYIPPPTQPKFSELSAAYKEKRRQSSTPIQPPQPKFGNNNSFGIAAAGSRASDSPGPSQSQRPSAMAHMPSLKNQAAQALANRHAEMERIRLEGQAKAKKLHDEQVALRKEEKIEVSEAETDSSSGDSDSDSDSDDSSDSEAKKATPKNKRLAGLKGGVAAPASASKAEGKKKKIDFGMIKKRYSLGSSLK